MVFAHLVSEASVGDVAPSQLHEVAGAYAGAEEAEHEEVATVPQCRAMLQVEVSDAFDFVEREFLFYGFHVFHFEGAEWVVAHLPLAYGLVDVCAEHGEYLVDGVWMDAPFGAAVVGQAVEESLEPDEILVVDLMELEVVSLLELLDFVEEAVVFLEAADAAAAVEFRCLYGGKFDERVIQRF